jgi:hypothetical protein
MYINLLDGGKEGKKQDVKAKTQIQRGFSVFCLTLPLGVRGLVLGVGFLYRD